MPPVVTPTPNPSPPPPAPYYFLAQASVSHLVFHSAAPGSTPSRMTPDRGAAYGGGQGQMQTVGVTPSKRQVIVTFTPIQSSEPQSIYAAAVSGITPDTPVLVAGGIDNLGETFATNDELVAFADGRDVFVARLDGSDASTPTFVGRANGRLRRLAFTDDWLAIDAFDLNRGESEVALYRLDDPEARPVIVPGTDLMIARGLPGGRLLVEQPGVMFVFDVARRDHVYADASGGLVGHTPDGETLVFTRNVGASTEIRAVVFDQQPARSFTIGRVNEVAAIDMSADGHFVFVMSYEDRVYEYRRFATSGVPAPGNGVIGTAPSAASRVIRASRDGRFVLGCTPEGLMKIDVLEGRSIVANACTRYSLVDLIDDGRIAIMSGGNDVAFVNVDTGDVDLRSRVTAHIIVRGGVVMIEENGGYGTIYRVELPNRIERVLPFASPPITEAVHIEPYDAILFERGGDWFTMPTDVRGPPTRVATGREGWRLAGVTDGYLALNTPTLLETFPLDGSSPDEPVTRIQTVGFAVWATADGHAISRNGPVISAVAVDAGPDAMEHVLYDGSFGVGPVMLHRGELFYAVRSPEGVDVYAVPFEGGPERLVMRRSGVLGGIEPNQLIKVPNLPRAFLSTRVDNGQAFTERLAMFPLDANVPTEPIFVGRAGQALWTQGGSGWPFIDQGGTVLLLGQDGLYAASTAGGEGRRILEQPAFRVGRALASPDGAWVVGQTGDGAVVAIPTRNDIGEAIRLTDDAEYGLFDPQGSFVFVRWPGGEEPALYRRSLTLSDMAERLTTRFHIDALIDTTAEGVLLRSREGGDVSVYLATYDGGRPLAITPVDDASETVIPVLESAD